METNWPRSNLWALLVLMPSFDVQAQQVFKCVAGEDVTYQSTPCADNQATAKSWDFGQYPPPSASDLQRLADIEHANRQRDAAARGSRRKPRTGTGGHQRTESSIGRCEKAKAHRDRELYKLGLRKKMSDLRAWDGHVAEACKP